MLNIIAPTKVLPISLNHDELKSLTPPVRSDPRTGPYSDKLAFTNRRRIPVLKN